MAGYLLPPPKKYTFRKWGGGVPEVGLWTQNMKYLNTKIKFLDIESKLCQ